MKVGIMQPYFFPYLGYFDLINSVDRWIAADSLQYMRHGWVNRNRVLHQKSGWQYITVPIRKKPLCTPISEIETSGGDWRTAILRSLQHYRKKAPFFDATYALVMDCLASETDRLSRLNVLCLERVCAYLGIPFVWDYLSEMDLELGDMEGPQDWAIGISTAVGTDEYVNLPGGAELYSADSFEARGLTLRIKPLIDFRYDCGGREFIPHLSIVDVLMWNSPQAVREYLDSVREL